MNPEKNFTKGVERLVNPMDVAFMHIVAQINGLLPRSLQNKLMNSSSKKYPYMGFVVEPYSFFLCYEILDLEWAKKLLPDGFKLIKTKIFDNDEPKYYVIFGCVNAHTSAFWGIRMEFYIIAEDEKTGLLTWVIIDYDTNTVGYDPRNGLRMPTTKNAVMATTHRGNIIFDINNEKSNRHLSFSSSILGGEMQNLDQRLWLEGNLSICYGRELSLNKAEPFSLKFDPLEVEKAWDMPISEVNIESNTWFPGLFASKPSKIACFPYAQHFVSDSPGHTSFVKSEEDLIKAKDELDFNKIEVFNTRSLKRMMVIGLIISSLTSLVLLILLIIK